jgi:putative endonuclease
MEPMLGLRLLEEFVHASDYLAVRLKRRELGPVHLELGWRGEEAAFFYLRRQGYVVVARGWRSARARGDLDLVAWKDEILCFIEVKTRSSRDVATAESAVDDDKIRSLRRLARLYIRDLPTPPEQVRFDILSIYFEAQKPADFELFTNAFGWRQNI